MHFYYNRYKAIIIGLLALFLSGCAAQAPYLRLAPALENDIKVFNNAQYAPLAKICDVYGIKWSWDPFIRTVTLERKGRIVMMAGSAKILVNGAEKTLERQVLLRDGAVFVPVSFVRSGIGYIIEAPSYARPRIAEIPPEVGYKAFTIRSVVLDAGHGGKDPGAIGRRLRLKEKDITLDVAKRLKRILETRGINVIMTRDDNTFVSLPKRAAIANRSDSDLFISIHANASRSKSMSGFECYYLSDATDDNARAVEAFENASLNLGEGSVLERSSKLDKTLWDMALTENRREAAALAGHICNSIERSSVARNRGAKTARFYVLKATRIPGVLVEMGYISNKSEEVKFREADYLDRMTESIAKGILSYKDEYERTEGFTNI